MDISTGVKVYCKSMGKVFRVRHIAKSDNEANEFCRLHPDTGVIAEDKTGLVYIAELFDITVPANALPD